MRANPLTNLKASIASWSNRTRSGEYHSLCGRFIIYRTTYSPQSGYLEANRRQRAGLKPILYWKLHDKQYATARFQVYATSYRTLAAAKATAERLTRS